MLYIPQEIANCFRNSIVRCISGRLVSRNAAEVGEASETPCILDDNRGDATRLKREYYPDLESARV